MATEHEFEAEIWQWSARDDRPGSWCFVSLPFDVADEIEAAAGPGRGFGSVPVEVKVGPTTWRTSVFPSAAEKTYVLPLKKPARAAAGLDVGDRCTVRLRRV